MKLTKEKVANYILQQVCLDDKELYSGMSSPTRIWTQIGSDAEGGVEPAVDIEVFEDRVVIGEKDIELPFPQNMKECGKLAKKINALLVKEYDKFEDAGVVPKTKYFVLVNAPDCPREVWGIFNNEKEAKDFAKKDAYLCVRKAKWIEGKLPNWNEYES